MVEENFTSMAFETSSGSFDSVLTIPLRGIARTALRMTVA
jgi:hypothetical protein